MCVCVCIHTHFDWNIYTNNLQVFKKTEKNNQEPTPCYLKTGILIIKIFLSKLYI